MKAIILAAGRGSRMKEMTSDQPKCLINVDGETLLDKQLQALRSSGINEIGIVTGYRSECLQGRGLVGFHNDKWADTNMVSSLACAREWLENEPCIVSYSDIFYQPQAVVSLMNTEALLAITYDKKWVELWTKRFGDPLLDAETFRISAEGFLLEIGNKPKIVAEIEGQYMGLLRFTPQSWNEISRIRSNLTLFEQNQMHMTGALQRVIDSGNIDIKAIPYDLEWWEVDSLADLIAYKMEIKGKKD